MKLTGVMMNSENSKALSDFYSKVFGAPGWSDNDFYGFDVGGNGNLMIGPHSEIKGKSKEPARIMVAYSTDDVQGEFDRLTELGALVIAEPYQPNADLDPKGYLATVADPDGNYIQISTPWPE